jgi:hypothetical protein
MTSEEYDPLIEEADLLRAEAKYRDGDDGHESVDSPLLLALAVLVFALGFACWCLAWSWPNA